jgi:hypothetical protein
MMHHLTLIQVEVSFALDFLFIFILLYLLLLPYSCYLGSIVDSLTFLITFYRCRKRVFVGIISKNHVLVDFDSCYSVFCFGFFIYFYSFVSVALTLFLLFRLYSGLPNLFNNFFIIVEKKYF